MATTRRKTTRRKATTPARRRTTAVTARPKRRVTRRKSLAAMPNKRALKSAAISTVKAAAGGALVGVIQNLAPVQQLTDPKMRALVPIGAAVLVHSMLKQPDVANGMAGAAVRDVMQSFGLADGSGYGVPGNVHVNLAGSGSYNPNLQDGLEFMSDSGYQADYLNF